jgi:hypothetical protein
MKSCKHCKTDFLYARPTFAAGAARLFDFGGLFDSYNESVTDEEADAKAISSDWALVGADILNALVVFENSKTK